MTGERELALGEYVKKIPARQYIVRSDKDFFLRFAACFGQYMIAHDMTISYRNLPLRLYELTHYSFRREQSGQVSGLKRLRAFTMPDLHTFCKDLTQATEEFKRQFSTAIQWMNSLHLESEVALRFVKEFYDNNKTLAQDLAKLAGKPILIELWNERYYYFVMKFEFNVIDSMKKASAGFPDQTALLLRRILGVRVRHLGPDREPLRNQLSLELHGGGGVELSAPAPLTRSTWCFHFCSPIEPYTDYRTNDLQECENQNAERVRHGEPAVIRPKNRWRTIAAQEKAHPACAGRAFSFKYLERWR